MLRSTLLAVLSVFCLVAVPLATCAQEVTNLVLNPSFEEDEIILDDPGWANWYTWGWEKGLESTIEFDENEFIDGTRSLRIEPKGDIDWHFILANDGNVVEAGKTFTASFWAKAEEERPIAAQMKATDNTASFCYTELGFITTEWQEFSIDLGDRDLSHIIGGFLWAATQTQNPSGAVFYLDEIRFLR